MEESTADLLTLPWNQLLIYQSICAYLGTLGGSGIGKTRGRDCGEDGGEEEAGDGGVLGGHDPGASAAFAGGSLGGRRTERTPYHCCPLASSKEEGKEHGEFFLGGGGEGGYIERGGGHYKKGKRKWTHIKYKKLALRCSNKKDRSSYCIIQWKMMRKYALVLHKKKTYTTLV
jgi:hypothetical protein